MKIFISVALSCFLAGCSIAGRVQKNTYEISTAVYIKDSIVVKVEPEHYNKVPRQIELNIKNNTGSIIQFGADYTIEKQSSGEWKEMEFTHAIPVISVMYMLQPGREGKYIIGLYPEISEYTEGSYRIVKHIFVNEEILSLIANFAIGRKN